MTDFKRWGAYEVGRSRTRNWHVFIVRRDDLMFYDVHFYDHPRPVGNRRHA